MRTTRDALFTILTLCVLLSAGCGKKATDEVDYGVVKDSVYRNQYFGFSLALPSEWSVQDQQARQRVIATGTKVLAGDDKNLNQAIKAVEPQTVYLLMAFQHPLGSPVAYNPNIVCVAERVRDMPGVVRGKDYLFHARRLLEAGQVKVNIEEQILTEKLGGVDFDVMRAALTVGPVTVQQKYYVAIKKGYALSFIASYTNDEEESAVQKIVQGASFK